MWKLVEYLLQSQMVIFEESGHLDKNCFLCLLCTSDGDIENNRGKSFFLYDGFL